MRGAWKVAAGTSGLVVALALALGLASGGGVVAVTSGCDAATEPCVPMCEGLSCGDDGCGGSCGTCEGAATCEAGVCVCIPDCTGKFCADDGCGTACFQCPGGFACGEEDTCDSVEGDEAYIPEGAFVMGCNEGRDEECASNELPTRTLTLPAYAVDVREVTVGAFRACVDAGECEGIEAEHCAWDESTFLMEDAEDKPVTCVDHGRAEAYCAWQGRALCTEAQWEKAARGGCETTGLAGAAPDPVTCGIEARVYPWGTAAPTCSDAIMKLCASEQYAHDVGSRDKDTSVYGVQDMGGNVSEWTADWYGSDWYATAPEGELGGPDGGAFRVVRGGSFADLPPSLRVSSRGSEVPNPDRGYADLGFRCCRALSEQ